MVSAPEVSRLTGKAALADHKQVTGGQEMLVHKDFGEAIAACFPDLSRMVHVDDLPFCPNEPVTEELFGFVDELCGVRGDEEAKFRRICCRGPQYVPRSAGVVPGAGRVEGLQKFKQSFSVSRRVAPLSIWKVSGVAGKSDVTADESSVFRRSCSFQGAVEYRLYWWGELEQLAVNSGKDLRP